ncbi:MAG: CHRD domain-containing protein [Ktedonobacteraceae bacterium]
MFRSYFTKRKMPMWVVFAVLVLLLLAGCGNGTPAASSFSSTPASQSASSNTGFTTASNGNVATATLKHTPTGTANLSWDHTTRMLTVQVMLTGLAPHSIHPNHIHEGSCASQGKVLYPLTNLVVDEHGAAQATTKIHLLNGIPAKGLYLNVHNGPALTTAAQFLPIACSDIINQDTSLRSDQTVVLAFPAAPSGSLNENANGMTNLSLSGHTLTVKLELSGLQPYSQHAAHIHSGSCVSQGAVIYPLNTVKADAAGKATVTTIIQNVTTIPSTGWYVNVHRNTDLSTQTGFDPIACGDVVLN